MVNVRLATDEDSADIFEWRNDEHTRKMSHEPNVVKWDVHKAWYQEKLDNDDCCLLLCFDDNNVKIGFMRFDIFGDYARISLGLNPDMRGKDKGKVCLDNSISFFHDSFANVRTLKAEIKDINIASKKTFEAIGFELEKVDNAIFYYSLHL